MRHGVKLILPVAILALAACGKGDSAARSADEESSVQVPAATGDAATTIHLVIQGGPHAGTYDAKSSEITCSYGLAGKEAWGNQYSVTGRKPTEFSSLQLIVPNAKGAAGGTNKFLLTVGFGQLMQSGYSEHTINTGAGLTGQSETVKDDGSGTITVKDEGTTGKVTFKGKTRDDVGLEGTIDCHQLLRND
ncbi:MAG: hypothetical protein QOH59_2817 [Gemmatimonadales bacterium]|jgi:hypothetical protein|nr:hypothetical protein [Gemmatimonadales bacterium]